MKSSNQSTFLLLIIAIAIISFIPYIKLDGFSYYDSKRVLQLTFLSIVAVSSLIYSLNFNLKEQRDYLKLSKSIFLLLSLFLIGGLISVYLSESYQHALLEYSMHIVLIFSIAFFSTKYRRRHWQLGGALFGSALLFSSIYVAIFLGNMFLSFFDPLIPEWPGRFSIVEISSGEKLKVNFPFKEVLYFENKRFFNHIQTWSLPLLLGILVYTKQIKSAKLYEYGSLLLITLWWMLIFASGARGTTVALISSSFIIFLFLKANHKDFFQSNLLTALFGGGLYILFFKILKSADKVPLARTRIGVRFDYWETSLEGWLAEPFFGMGPMHFAKVDSVYWSAHPHNYFVQILTEWGLISFLALTLLLVVWATRSVKLFNAIDLSKRSKILYYAVIWSAAAGLIHSLVSGVMHTPISQLFLIFILAWLLSFLRRKTEFKSYFEIPKHYVGIGLIVIIILVLIMGFELPFYDEPASRVYPRFWNRGNF